MRTPILLFRRDWPAAELVAAHPPRLQHPHKRLLHDEAALSGPPTGMVAVSRWSSVGFPQVLDGVPQFTEAVGYFAYAASDPGTVDWHQNFADPLVFGFYGGQLYAQDEMMVAEHPVLASVHESLRDTERVWTSVPSGPTPILVVGAERRVTVDTDPSTAPGRGMGLYGNRFAAASAAVIRSATRRIVPPTLTNVVALAAPRPASGRYTREQIERVLLTATTGYQATMVESERLFPGSKVVIHTGFWGCGAFGGNRVLMVALQAIAARLTGVHKVVFHVGDRSGLQDTAEARALLGRVGSLGAVSAVAEALVAQRFVWGTSDGN